jgi:hypothetical protein
MSPCRPHPRRFCGRWPTVAPPCPIVANVRTPEAYGKCLTASQQTVGHAPRRSHPRSFRPRTNLLKQPATAWSVSYMSRSSDLWPRLHRRGLLLSRARGCPVRGWRRRRSARASASGLPIRRLGNWHRRSNGSLRLPGRRIRTTGRARSPERPGRAMSIRTMTFRSTGSLPETRSGMPRTGSRRPGPRGRWSSTPRRAASTPARARCRRAGGWQRSPGRRCKAKASRSRCSTSPA